MALRSTTSPALKATWRDAVLHGLAPDGGLYVPESLPLLTAREIEALTALPFPELAIALTRPFLADEVPEKVIHAICTKAFTFDVPLVEISRGRYILELFHGPTCAFKDFGARFMSHLFRHFWGSQPRQLTVLVATSGDTGSAVANAFLDRSGAPPIKVTILFPKNKVSLVQEKQMTTLGGNVTACEVDGTFDDCQRLVKQALNDRSLLDHVALTSANSINIARLLPQMFYYAYASASLLGGPAPIVSVPSGNLGNLTGGLLAHMLGFPIAHFIAATNSNAVFPNFLSTGTYAPAPSVETISNAMDVGNPSNFARIASLYGEDVSAVQRTLSGYSVSEQDTVRAIQSTYRDTGYIVDPHTAVGVNALERYRADRNIPSDVPSIVLATAHPAKFAPVVKDAIGVEPELPPQLRAVLDAEGHKVALPNSYEALKNILL